MPHDNAKELIWIDRARAGDGDAFAALVERYWTPIYRWLYGLARDVHLAEDVTQETFLKAWANLQNFEGNLFRAWLFQIARNSLADRRRALRVRRRQELPDGLPSKEPGPPAAAISRETQARVSKAVAALPLPFRAPFLLRTQEELSYGEIAHILSLTEETVRWRVFKARQRLLGELGASLDRVKP